MQNFEKLGFFYLGKEYDFANNTLQNTPFLLNDRQLTTHAVILGMTGSGKTGLGIVLLEEAAIDNVPALIIDPKGDLSNLLLTFPSLKPSDFAPWMDDVDAARSQQTAEQKAEKVAKQWKEGLESWGEDGQRIQKLKDSIDTVIYTPASQAGIPLSILSSFDPPPKDVLLDSVLFQSIILSTVSGLLALMGIKADPLKSKEHILLSTIFENEWKEGRALDLSSLISFIQNPPFNKVGVIDLESFYSAKERQALAINVNNLIASPSFKSWMEGEPLDIQHLLYTKEGKPRHAILSIAHLQDAERMFFVTILLNRLIAWMRMQPGTSVLRALLYMDEIFGFFPPVANPPSKAAMLTLLKQARAYGLGIILSTQNPGDIDYKALANCGLWFIGKLQTDRDRAKVLEGLRSSHPDIEALTMEKLSLVRNRLFMLQSIYEEKPVFFETRWTLSYLKGPLTLPQIDTLMAGRKPLSSQEVAEKKASTNPLSKPLIAPSVKESYLITSLNTQQAVWIPKIIGKAKLHFANSQLGIDQWIEYTFVSSVKDQDPYVDWFSAEDISKLPVQLSSEKPQGGLYSAAPPALANDKNWAKWQKEFEAFLYQEKILELYEASELKLRSNEGETEGEFRVRLALALKENREIKREKILENYEPKIQSIKEKIKRCEQKIAEKQTSVNAKKVSTVLSVGETILKLFSSKKLGSNIFSKAGTSVRNAQKISKEQQEVLNAEEELKICSQNLQELESSLNQELQALQSSLDAQSMPLKTITVRSRKSDSQYEALGLLWYPDLSLSQQADQKF